MNDWIDPDAHSLGMVIKYNGGSGNNRYVTVAAPSQVNSPVLVVNFSSLDAEQLTARRISSDTYTTYATFTWQSRNSVSEDSNAYMAQLWCNGDLRSSIALVDPLTNRIYRTAKSIYPSTGRWGSNSPTWGLQYDQTTHRYWISGNDANGKIVLGYTPAYQLNSWTTVTNTNIATGKSAMTVVNDVCYCFALNGITEPTESDPYVNDLDYFTYTRTSNTWSSPTTVVSQTVATKRNIVNAIGAGDTLDGTTNILCDGSLDSYPSFGFFTVDSEFFWYQSKSGSTFNNVTRATFGSTAAAHSAGAQAKHLVGIPTYTSIEHDPQNNCLHVTWSYNKVRGGSSAYEYMGLGYLRHYYADSATTWKKSDDTSETLPYIPANIQLISDNTGLCYPNTLLCSPTGDVVQMYTKTNSFTSSSYNKIMLSYLHSGQTSFTKVDPGFATSNIIPAATSLGNDNMSLTCIYTGTQRKSMSENAGETWSALQDVSTHSFNVRSTLTGSGMSNGSSVDGYSLSYYQGAGTSSGSVWINAIEMTPAAPSTLDATVNGSQVDLTWADNSTTETGFYISRSVDGGAFTDNYDTAAADAETYSDTTLPGGWETLTYRVASYNTIGTSPWSNEVTIYSAIPIDGNGLTSDTSQDSLTVVQTHALSGTGFDSDTSIDTTTISQTHIFSSNGLTSDANNDTLSISQTHIITLNGLTSDTATDNLSLASSVKLNPEQHFIYDEEFAIRLGVSKVSTWTERPEGTEGMFGFNDTTGRFEIFHNNAWDLMERWDDLRFPAQAVNPVGAASDPTWDVDNIGWGFSASATNMVQIVAQIPHAWKIGSELRPHIHWQPTSTNTGNVLWRMEYKWTNANDTESGTWTTIDVLDAGDGTIGKHQIASFAAIDGTGKGLSSILSIKLSRIGGDGTDTYTGVALMKEFDIHYVVDGDGSRQEYIK
jgi:hypothetical protein